MPATNASTIPAMPPFAGPPAPKRARKSATQPAVRHLAFPQKLMTSATIDAAVWKEIKRCIKDATGKDIEMPTTINGDVTVHYISRSDYRESMTCLPSLFL